MADKRDNAGDEKQLIALMSPLKSMELQIGENVFEALRQDDTVAVLSIVSETGGEQRIISVPLDAKLLARVQELLGASDVAESPRVPCVGFHCPRPIEDDSGRKENK